MTAIVILIGAGVAAVVLAVAVVRHVAAGPVTPLEPTPVGRDLPERWPQCASARRRRTDSRPPDKFETLLRMEPGMMLDLGPGQKIVHVNSGDRRIQAGECVYCDGEADHGRQKVRGTDWTGPK